MNSTTLLFSLRCHQDSVTSLDYLDGQLLSSSADGSVCLWNLATRRPSFRLSPSSNSSLPGGVLSSSVVVNKLVLIQFRGGQHYFHDIESNTTLYETNTSFSGFCKSVSLSSDTFACGSATDGLTEVHDFRLNQKVIEIVPKTIEQLGYLSCLSFIKPYHLATFYESGSMHMYDLRSPSDPFCVYPLFNSAVLCSAALPSGEIVTGSTPDHPLMLCSSTIAPRTVSLGGSSATFFPGISGLSISSNSICCSLYTGKSLLLSFNRKEMSCAPKLWVEHPLVVRQSENRIYSCVNYMKDDRVFIGGSDGNISVHLITK
ncbi:hypothetical protein RCL1_004596 [Eukaryota sp. TZLM3-RCL]